MFISAGVASIMIFMQSLIIGTVVRNTMIEKRRVHIGSIMCRSGFRKIIRPAIVTPILWQRSPITWISAARMFMFSWLWP